MTKSIILVLGVVLAAPSAWAGYLGVSGGGGVTSGGSYTTSFSIGGVINPANYQSLVTDSKTIPGVSMSESASMGQRGASFSLSTSWSGAPQPYQGALGNVTMDTNDTLHFSNLVGGIGVLELNYSILSLITGGGGTYDGYFGLEISGNGGGPDALFVGPAMRGCLNNDCGTPPPPYGVPYLYYATTNYGSTVSTQIEFLNGQYYFAASGIAKIPIINDQVVLALDLSGGGEAYAGGNYGSSSYIAMDFSAVIGAATVFASNGYYEPNAYIGSDSGYDYTQPLSTVPEPSLNLLLGIGLGTVSLIGWRFKG